ncbi:MAG: Septum formation initiator [Thermocaproicibacter melissae]|uniref:FtsB family cell division protein n=2 Tax=Thermocaproicibacter melissae TaxID=2966552 RepID=UPI003A0FB864
MMKLIKGQKPRKSILLRVAIVAFAIYAIMLLVQQQAEINAKKQELASVEQQIKIQEIKNDDLRNALGSGQSDYIEKAARESLGYSKPGERVFVNIAGK